MIWIDNAPHQSFRDEVLDGLRGDRKRLPCKYLYDEEGSRLFDRICELEEYYPTRTELGIMRRSVGEMAAEIGPRCLLIEYGSGSGLKTRVLLDALDAPATYVPIEISRDYLEACAARLRRRYPDLEILPLCADYTADYELPPSRREHRRRVVYFPGSTIGNFTRTEAREFLRHVADVCGPGGGLLIGVDLKKDREVLERAYNDSSGVTAAFNRNLLVRINRELEADVPVEQFEHRAHYNEDEGRVEMHLVSRRHQVLEIDGEEIRFERGETIHTESSYKYGVDEFRDLAEEAGLTARRVWTDPRRLFSVQYMETE